MKKIQLSVDSAWSGNDETSALADSCLTFDLPELLLVLEAGLQLRTKLCLYACGR